MHKRNKLDMRAMLILKLSYQHGPNIGSSSNDYIHHALK
jgi:hypothetical protein